MLISKRLLGTSLLISLSFSPALAANVSVSFGKADFEMFYAFARDGETARGQTIDEFNYVDLGLSVNRDKYTFGVNVSQLMEQEVSEYGGNGNRFIGFYDTKRDSYSFSVSRNISEKLHFTAGYYSATVTVESDTPGKSDTTDTDAFFGSLTYADRLTDELFWYGRLGAQLNDAELNLVNDEDNFTTASLDGDGVVFGAGIYYPLDEARSLTFAVEQKDFTYDNAQWDLEESQTLLSIGYNFQF